MAEKKKTNISVVTIYCASSLEYLTDEIEIIAHKIFQNHKHTMKLYTDVSTITTSGKMLNPEIRS